MKTIKTVILISLLAISVDMQAQKNNVTAVKNSASTHNYDTIQDFNVYRSRWALVKQNGKYGFINVTGKEVVKPIYDEIQDFNVYRDNWARVKLNNKYGFINHKGKEVVKPIYDSIKDFNVYRPDWAQIFKDGKTGFIDRKGKEVTNLK